MKPGSTEGARGDRIALTPREAARLVGCRPEAIREAVRRGALAARTIGNRVKISRASLDAWLLGCDVEPAGGRKR